MQQDTTWRHPAEPGLPSGVLDEVFARQIRAIRQAAPLTQQQLADLVGMHRTAIAKIEAGDRVVSVGEAVKLAAALGATVAELVTDPDPEARPVLEARARLRSAEHEAARRRDLMEEAQLLYAHALEVLAEARQQLAALDGGDGP